MSYSITQKSKTFIRTFLTGAKKDEFWLWLAVFVATFGIIFLGGFFFLRSLTNSQIINNENRYIPVSTFSIAPAQTSGLVINQPVTTTGCNTPLSLTPGHATFVKIESAGQTRRTLVYLPKNYSNLVPHPLVIVFHGYNDTPSNMERFVKFDALAESDNFIVTYPEGSKALGGELGWDTGLHPTIRGNDLLFVSNMLNNLQANLCINKNQIYATGFSNGGGFVGELACKLSGRIAAFAPVSGSYLTTFDSCSTPRPVSVMEFHGTADNIVPYLGEHLLREVNAFNWVSSWAKKDGCSPIPNKTNDSRLVTKYTWINCRGNASVIHYKISGERHVWPNVLFAQNIGNKVKYVNAAQTIWNFFKQHPF